MKKGFEPGSFGCHEVLHMASFLVDTVDEQLCQHPSVQSNPKLEKLAIKAVDALGNLYNAIGKTHIR